MIEKMKIGSKGRLLSNVLSRKLTPFHALKELINNSLWANAKCITISLKEQPIPSTLFTGIGEIEVVDDKTEDFPLVSDENDLRELIPEGAFEYIKTHHLYERKD